MILCLYPRLTGRILKYQEDSTMGKFVMRQTATGVKFDLKASNGEVIATSEVYTTDAACKNGIESVKKNAPEAEVVADA